MGPRGLVTDKVEEAKVAEANIDPEEVQEFMGYYLSTVHDMHYGLVIDEDDFWHEFQDYSEVETESEAEAG
jgi:hypothetical protein